MNIDLQILIDELVEENSERRGPISIQPDEFCDLLTNGEIIEIYGVKLNQKRVLNDRARGSYYLGYSHTLMYSGKMFSCSTSIELTNMDYLWGN